MALYRESYLFFIGTDEPALFWTGYGDLVLPADAVLAETSIALGGGEIINIPEVEQLINGIAQRLEVTLSGVSPATIAFAVEEAAQVSGAPVNIGRIQFDENWQMVGAVEWEWSGEAQNLSVSGESSGNGRTRSITLRIAAGDTTRARSPIAFFTDADQRREFPDDAIFSHVGGINAGTSRRWGPSE